MTDKDKITEVLVTLERVETILDINTESLKEHMRRTDVLEKKVLKGETIFWFAGVVLTSLNVGISIWSKL